MTDSSGTVVYAAAHEPYGGIQKTWVTTYDPALKFSGKQRDAESELDYFGARYYDRSLYRFMSVDPVIPAGKAVANSQRWNLYSYCLGNPTSYADPTGAAPLKFSLTIVREANYYYELSCYGRLYYGNGIFLGHTLENIGWQIPSGTYKGTLLKKEGWWIIVLNKSRWVLAGPPGQIKRRTAAIMDSFEYLPVSKVHECILVSDQEAGADKSRLPFTDLMDYLSKLIRVTEAAIQSQVFTIRGIADRALYSSAIGMVMGWMRAADSFSLIMDNWDNMQVEIEVTIRDER